ncbi:hypothetical protein CMV_007640 [Castanea mollissima]|uniref:Apple domain-containing protein n=1 Tax=Castanea mollissima TaxID=60419 RepID=A0A8J4VSP7_9ROSI|nr:hypothetical protein CMV_007640 [Castanea mollissima]
MSSDYGAVLHRRLTVDYDDRGRRSRWRLKEVEVTKSVEIGGDRGRRSRWRSEQIEVTKPVEIGADRSHEAGGDRSRWRSPKQVEIGADRGRRSRWRSAFPMQHYLVRHPTAARPPPTTRLVLWLQLWVSSQLYTFDQCWDLCLQLCDCKAFQYSFKKDIGFSTCYLKTPLLNGYQLPSFSGDVFLKVPQSNLLSYAKPIEEFNLNCSNRTNVERYENGTIKFVLWFASGVAGLEVICIFVEWCLLNETRKRSGADKQGYALCANRFKNFTHAELKKPLRVLLRKLEEVQGEFSTKGKGPSSSIHAIHDGVEAKHRLQILPHLKRSLIQCWKVNMTWARWKLWFEFLYNALKKTKMKYLP